MAGELPFEKILHELAAKIGELRKFGADRNINITEEVSQLEERYNRLEEEIYSGLTVLQKIQIARLPQRPTTLDYIQTIFTDFLELHGDRLFGDDLAIVGSGD